MIATGGAGSASTLPLHAAPTRAAAAGLLHRITGTAQDYDGLVEAIGNASIVLIGEASHGTHEFYRERARLTSRLIDAGFDAVAIEGDWPDALRADRYVRGDYAASAGIAALPSDDSARAALRGFRRFPSWMWRNTVVADWLEWLRARNAAERFGERRAGFYGLDLYSLRTSMADVIAYLDQTDPAAADAARHRYACFDSVGIADAENLGQEYGYAVTRGHLDPCEDAVVAQLVDLQHRRAALLAPDGPVAEDAYFAAARNAALVHNAEIYYREMYRGRASSWNLRDTHMADTLAALREHLSPRVDQPRIVVWAHNSHVGDARATALARPDRPGGEAQLNLGQLVRQRWPGESFIVGLTTTRGTVTAAADWGGPMLRRQVLPAGNGTFEQALSSWGVAVFWTLTGTPLDGRTGYAAASGQQGPSLVIRPGDVLLERAIGVIYRPETEHVSHWFAADLHAQFDAVIHIDRTSALEPLDRTVRWDRGEPPETYPTGL
jgi:erythromycin esterase-like protein